MSAPSPSIMQRFAPRTQTATVVLAETDPATIVRPGTRPVTTLTIHDGVVKAKHIEKGMVVRAWLHDAPRGAERTVAGVQNKGATVLVTFEEGSPEPQREYKAAYRFYVEALVGKPIQHTTQVPALVAYEEV